METTTIDWQHELEVVHHAASAHTKRLLAVIKAYSDLANNLICETNSYLEEHPNERMPPPHSRAVIAFNDLEDQYADLLDGIPDVLARAAVAAAEGRPS